MGPATGQVEPVFDKQDQFDKIRAGLLDGERIIAVYDGKGAGTGFIGVTDRRVIVQDNSFAGKKTALTSVPYRRITAVSYLADKSMFGKFASSSTIAISAGGKDYEVEFRGEEKAKHVHDVVLWHILNAA
jgi:PH (Pleckstrin Homology) domain-containing protein